MVSHPQNSFFVSVPAIIAHFLFQGLVTFVAILKAVQILYSREKVAHSRQIQREADCQFTLKRNDWKFVATKTGVIVDSSTRNSSSNRSCIKTSGPNSTGRRSQNQPAMITLQRSFIIIFPLLLFFRQVDTTIAWFNQQPIFSPHPHRPQRQRLPCQITMTLLSPLRSSADDDDDDDDTSFYEDLRRAKKEKLGGAIPQDQLTAAAAAAEEEFLRAMENVGREFHETKAELGSDAAIDLMMERIRLEDEKRDQAFENDDEDDDDDT